MNTALNFASQLGLRITTRRFPIAARKTIILAAVYPHLKEIVLFENQIELYCRSRAETDKDKLVQKLILHEIHHYLSWLQSGGKGWRAADPAAERAATRFAESWAP